MPALAPFQRKRILPLLIFVFVCLALCSSVGTAQASRATSPHTQSSSVPSPASSFTCGTWSVVSSPNVTNGALFDVAALSASNIWAVGSYTPNNSVTLTLIEHWNGTSWSVVSSPNVGSVDNSLNGVAVVSASNIWAVGSFVNSSGNSKTLVEHWNGTSWNVVPSPNKGSSNDLVAVAVVSASNVWAVGSYNNSTLIEQWNGTSWNMVSSPNVGLFNNILTSVAVVSASDIWAVGDYENSSTSPSQTLTEHWNGTNWSVVTSPNKGSGSNHLTGVASNSTSNVWAVGFYFNSSSVAQTLTEHWNGTKWSGVPSPNVGSNDYDQLTGVTAISASNVWAVGIYRPGGSRFFQTLTEQWNGSSWSLVSSPNASSNDTLNRVARVPGSNNLWAVGDYINSSATNEQPLIEYYC